MNRCPKKRSTTWIFNNSNWDDHWCYSISDKISIHLFWTSFDGVTQRRCRWNWWSISSTDRKPTVIHWVKCIQTLCDDKIWPQSSLNDSHVKFIDDFHRRQFCSDMFRLCCSNVFTSNVLIYDVKDVFHQLSLLHSTISFDHVIQLTTF